MGPPGLGVGPAPRASQDQRWLPEVQLRTSHHIYGAASLLLLTILCLPHQQHTDSSLLREEPATNYDNNYYTSSYGCVLLPSSSVPGELFPV